MLYFPPGCSDRPGRNSAAKLRVIICGFFSTGSYDKGNNDFEKMPVFHGHHHPNSPNHHPESKNERLKIIRPKFHHPNLAIQGLPAFRHRTSRFPSWHLVGEHVTPEFRTTPTTLQPGVIVTSTNFSAQRWNQTVWHQLSWRRSTNLPNNILFFVNAFR